MGLRLYTWWRSHASFRVRIALRLKGLHAEMSYVDLAERQQHDPAFAALNPAQALPVLIDGDGPPLLQSLAILEYLEEQYPEPPLLPRGARERAHVRALAQVLAADAHPLIVPRVRSYLESTLGIDEAGRVAWLRHWQDEGLRSFERMAARYPGSHRFAFGSSPTIADICLVAHVTSSQMLFGVDLAPYPTIARAYGACMQLDAFALAHPMQQPDKPASP